MPSKKTSRFCDLVLLAIALALASTSCATNPKPPEPNPVNLPLAWPILPPPPESLELDAAEANVIVPLDYWLELVGYVRATGAVREILRAEGRIIE